MIRRKISARILSASTTPELSELLRVYPDAAAQVAPIGAHEQEDVSAQGAAMAALEQEPELLRQELSAVKEREKWFQNQIQQRLLPPPRQGIIERIAEAVARLRRPRGNT